MKKTIEFAKNNIFCVRVNLSLILGLGLILRLISLNQSLWLDEATTALAAKMTLTDLFTKFFPGDFHPPLYYLLLKAWVSLSGNSEIALRLPSVLWGVVTVYITYLIGSKLINKKVGLLAAFFLAISGLAIYYSQEARMYSLTALLVSMAVYYFVNNKWVWFSLTVFMIGMTDYVALFVLPVFWLFGIKKDYKKLILSHVPLILFFVFWWQIFMSQLNAGAAVAGSAWWTILGTITFKNIILIPVKFILGRISFDNKYLYAGIVAIVVSLYGYVIIRTRLKDRPFSVLWGWLLFPIALGVLVSVKVPILSYFRFLFCLPAFYILLAVGVENSGKYKKIFLFLLVLANLLSSLYYLLTPRFWREDWRSAALAVQETTLVLPSDSQKEALIYYGKGDNTIFYKNFDKESGYVWLSRYVYEVFDPNDSAKRKLENLGYNKVLEANFNGVVLYKYARRN
jgi:uncharacterized membrane protein